MRRNSYNFRFLYKKKRLLRKRTKKNSFGKTGSKKPEEDLFTKQYEKFRWIYLKYMERRPKYLKNNHKPLHKRKFKSAQVYFRHFRKNSFATITENGTRNLSRNRKVKAKFSCGSVGYTGPKKPTPFARIHVAKAVGNFLSEQQYSMIDLNIKRSFNRRLIKQLRNVIASPIFVRHITLSVKRSHGFTRARKQRRT